MALAGGQQEDAGWEAARLDVVVAIDQGTTGTTVLAVNRAGAVVAKAYREIKQHYPQPGWVEHDGLEIWFSVTDALGELFEALEAAHPHFTVVTIGLTNQRETVLLWERATGRPVHRAIVWQCRRTASVCQAVRESSDAAWVQARTGLIPDAYFSATKIAWVLDQDAELRRRAQAGELAAGTVDSWLIWQLTGGRVHATDVTNASRTLLFDIHRLCWDDDLLSLFRVPRALLPTVLGCSEVYGTVTSLAALKPAARARLQGVPVSGVAGDQHAALFGQACFAPGSVKNTYGTGCFALVNVGERPAAPTGGLLGTVAWKIGPQVTYALEGSVFVAGAAVQWLRDELGIIQTAGETASLAASVPDTGGVYFVPAFVGLGAPYWDPHARGTIVGLTRGTTRAHIVRAALEAIAYQSRSLVDAMSAAAELPITSFRADGGAAQNDFLLQFQADMTGLTVHRPSVVETTGLGAAYLAGLAVGFWPDLAAVERLWRPDRTFVPGMTPEQREHRWRGWQEAVGRSLNWATRAR